MNLIVAFLNLEINIPPASLLEALPSILVFGLQLHLKYQISKNQSGDSFTPMSSSAILFRDVELLFIFYPDKMFLHL